MPKHIDKKDMTKNNYVQKGMHDPEETKQSLLCWSPSAAAFNFSGFKGVYLSFRNSLAVDAMTEFSWLGNAHLQNQFKAKQNNQNSSPRKNPPLVDSKRKKKIQKFPNW